MRFEGPAGDSNTLGSASSERPTHTPLTIQDSHQARQVERHGPAVREHHRSPVRSVQRAFVWYSGHLMTWPGAPGETDRTDVLWKLRKGVLTCYELLPVDPPGILTLRASLPHIHPETSN